MKPVHFCIGFIYCTFPAIVKGKIELSHTLSADYFLNILSAHFVSLEILVKHCALVEKFKVTFISDTSTWTIFHLHFLVK